MLENPSRRTTVQLRLEGELALSSKRKSSIKEVLTRLTPKVTKQFCHPKLVSQRS
jgi:hypothetical protein